MKSRLLIVLSVLLLSTVIQSQTFPSTSEPAGIGSLDDVGSIVKQIVKASGQKANFTIMAGQVPNALAVLKNGRRYIIYNPDFIDLLTRATGTKWAAVSVLAHEIGHHLSPNSIGKEKVGLATEIEADEFSGYVLQKMGATIDEAKAAMNLLATSRATATHPAGADRLNAITLGWRKAGGVDQDAETAFQKNGETYPSQVYRTASTSAGSTIAATIYLTENPGIVYYVTSKLNIYETRGNRVKQVGWLKRSTSRSYPYIMLDEEGGKLFINRYGIIVDEDGNAVGKIKALTNTEG